MSNLITLPSLSLRAVRSLRRRLVIARHFITQWHRRLEQSGFDYHHTAKQMRKAGIPLETALEILLPGANT